MWQNEQSILALSILHFVRESQHERDIMLQIKNPGLHIGATYCWVILRHTLIIFWPAIVKGILAIIFCFRNVSCMYLPAAVLRRVPKCLMGN